ncbi:Cilia BBSome complex subunit 10, putative [Trypanosoma equiperdum]|uniref:Cilia BBSome complex subunit 10, putative n=1 Tax=Trypanosoma equiperdum TaxID=5694 RepID=A0A1G4IHU1_TRYEQ|nr:Cilia BBSome complex subunit 10, putative [Trypanosoma equiperdum]
MEQPQQRAGSDETLPAEVLPTTGFVFHESEEPKGLLCPPKLLPIKSFALERLEHLEKRMEDETKAKRQERQQQKATPQWNTSPTNLRPPLPKPVQP